MSKLGTMLGNNQFYITVDLLLKAAMGQLPRNAILNNMIYEMNSTYLLKPEKLGEKLCC